MSVSTEVESLSSIISGSSAVVTSAPEPAKAEPATDVKPEPAKAEESAAPSAVKEPEATKPEHQRNDKGQFAPKETKETKPEPMVPLSALLAERAKRREPETPKPKTSVLENEDQAFNERLTEHVAPLKEAVFEMSMQFARTTYSDFDEVSQAFAQAANNDERLWQAMRDAKNPALYVYQVGKQFKELAPFGGDLMRYREHLTSDTAKKLAEAEQRASALAAELEVMKKSKADLDAVPRSLNSTGSGAQPSVADSDPEDLRKITRFGNT